MMDQRGPKEHAIRALDQSGGRMICAPYGYRNLSFFVVLSGALLGSQYVGNKDESHRIYMLPDYQIYKSVLCCLHAS